MSDISIKLTCILRYLKIDGFKANKNKPVESYLNSQANIRVYNKFLLLSLT